VASQLKVNEIIKQSGSSITIGVDGDTVSGPFTNTPSFAAKITGNQSISNDTDTKVAFDTVVWDTDSAFSTSTYRFTVPAGKGGKYYLQAHTQIPGIDANEIGQIMIYINGSHDQLASVREQKASSDRIFRMITAYTVSLSAGDYVEIYVYQNSGDAQNATNQYFTGHRIIGA
tara:strand:+ start:62 stop:580 length:519 start_codon:yes stop_codon:yes gene_type:complete